MDVFDLVAKISIDTSEYDRGLTSASENTNGFGSKLKSALGTFAKAGGAALAGATTAVVGFGKAAVETGLTFDSAMSQVAATMGVTTQSIGNLRDFAIDMGSKTAFSATEAAEALNFMALAGYNDEQAMSALPNVLNLAAAGNIDLASASDMVTDAQSALGLTMEQSATLVDQMAKASSKSNTSVAQLGDAILTVGGTAKNLAGGTTELNTALGILADNGVKSAEGGTALRNIILSLGAPTDKAAKLMSSLGLEVYDANGNMRPLNETFGDLNDVLSTMTMGEQTQVLNSIFNKVDLKSVNALLAGTASGFDGIGFALQASSVDWGTYVDDIRARTGDMSITTEDLFNDISNFLTGMLELGYDTEEQQKILQEEFGLTAEDAAAAIESVNASVLESGTRWDELTGYIDDAAGAAEKMAATQLDNLAGDITLFKSALEGAQIVVSDQLTPTLRDFVQFGSTSISTLSDAFKEGGLSGAMEALGTILSDGLNMVISKVPDMIDAGMKLLGALGQGLLQNTSTITNAAVKIVTMLVNGLVQGFPSLAQGAVQIITELASGIGKALPQLIPAAVEAIWKFVEGLTSPSAISGLLSAAADLIGGLVQGIGNALPTVSAAVPQIISNIIEGLIAGLPQFLEIGLQLLAGLGQGLINGLAMIPQIIGAVVEGIINGFKSLFGIHSPSTVFAEMGGMLIQGLLQGLQNAWEGIVTFFSTVLDGIKTTLSNAWDSITETASTAWEGITTFLGDTWDGIKETAGNIFDNIKDGIGRTWEGVKDTTSQVWDGLTGWLGNTWDKLTGKSEESFGATSSAIKEKWLDTELTTRMTWDELQKYVTDVWQGMQKGAEEKFKSIYDNVHKNWESADEDSKSTWAGIESVLDGTWAGLEATSGIRFDAMKTNVETAWKKANTSTNTEWGTLVTTVGGKALEALTAVGDNFGKMEGTVVEKLGSARAAAKGVDFSSVGVGIVDGMTAGVQARAQALAGSVVSAAQMALGAAKSAMGIHSPSTVFRDIIGMNIGEGMAVGVDRSQKNVIASIYDMADNVQSAFDTSFDFGAISTDFAPIPVTYPASAARNQSEWGAGFPQMGSTTVNIYSPKAVDAIEAARQWKKTTQQLAMGF